MFKPAVLKWRGRDVTIPAHRILGAIATVENVLTMKELHDAYARNAPPLARIAQAYGAALRYAGADVLDDDVYFVLTTPGAENDAISEGLAALFVMLVPPGAITAAVGVSSGNEQAPVVAKPAHKQVRRK